jgi:hypothetical protein
LQVDVVLLLLRTRISSSIVLLCCALTCLEHSVDLKQRVCCSLVGCVSVLLNCVQVSELIERFAEGSAEREAPVHALKKALQLVATDCHASYARCVHDWLRPSNTAM